jgi:thiosulfate/3-mercaptopyruvate sulfurtransferase
VRGKALGVSGDVPVVVVACSVKGWGEDGRIVWTLRTLGHPAAVFVDGAPGIKAKNDAGSNWDWSSADATEYPLVTGTN